MRRSQSARSGKKADHKYSPDMLIQRLIQPLSLDAQQSIVSLVNIMQTNERASTVKNDLMKHEMAVLRNDCDKTKSELLVAIRNANIHNGKVSEMMERYEALKSQIRDGNDHAIRNQLLIHRLQHDNLLLKESFETMNLSAPPHQEPQQQFTHRQRMLDSALRDAELMIANDDAGNDAIWFDPTETPDTPYVHVTEYSNEATAEEPKGRRPATAPSVSSSAVATASRAAGVVVSKMETRVQFDSSTIERQRPSTTSGTGRGGGQPPSKGLISSNSDAVDPKLSPIKQIDVSLLAATTESGRPSSTSKFGRPKDDYILPQSTHPINGTFRNPPDSHLVEKLRHALLRMTRDKYRSGKREKILNTHIDNLKIEIKELEQKIRHLQIELAEFRGHSEGIEFAATFHGKQPVWHKEKTFGPMDELFKTMIERRAFNPVDMILQFRRIVDYLSRLPGTLNVAQIARHMGSKDMMQILEVDMIVIFIAEPNNPSIVKKYTCRSEKPEQIDLTEHKCMYAEMLKCRHSLKTASIMGNSSSLFNPAVDGSPGVAAYNAMIVPLKDDKGLVIGALQLVNKAEGKAAFTELDDLFTSVYAGMCVSALLACEKFKHVTFRSDILAGILDAPVPLMALMPDPDSLFVKDILLSQVLTALESICKVSLRCLRVKAFLCSDSLKTVEDGYLVALDAKAAKAASARAKTIPLLKTPLHLGAAGYAVRTNKIHVVSAGELDVRAHPDVDIETSGMEYFTIPVFSVRGKPLACVQLIVGPSSPKVKLVDGKADNVSFLQAAEWLVRILRPPLTAVIASIGEDLTSDSMQLPRPGSAMLISPKSSRSTLRGTPSPQSSPTRKTSKMWRRVAGKGLVGDADDLNDDDLAAERVFEVHTSEVEEIQQLLAAALKDNEELKTALAAVQSMYLSETRAKTLEMVAKERNGSTSAPSGPHRRSFQ